MTRGQVLHGKKEQIYPHKKLPEQGREETGGNRTIVTKGQS